MYKFIITVSCSLDTQVAFSYKTWAENVSDPELRVRIPAGPTVPSRANNSGYGEWHPRGTRATQCLGV
jgi:hypothetical protein